VDLVLEHLDHSYGALPVLRDVSLRVGAGEIVAVIGPSGCGKSTLLGIAGGLLRPDAGTVVVEGEAPPDSLNPFTYVFQDFALLPWRTVAGNVALALEHHALSAAGRAARVADALRRTGLAEFRDAYPKQLSGGMRQRVGIARALVVCPAMLLMDEPLSALDAQTRELLTDDFLALWEEQRVSALWVTHNLPEALRVADRVAVLSRRPGRIKAVVPVAIPQRERRPGIPELLRLGEDLWESIRGEAQVAEREVADV
jgi:NitT/TauT family transport system ATP-binding protein